MSKKSERLTSSAKPTPKRDWFSNLEEKINSGMGKWMLAILIITGLFSIFHFNARVSEGGDDSTYLLAASNYAKDFTGYYFSFNAPGYPMIMSFVVRLFGMNLLLFKFLSVIFNLLGVYFLFKALRGRISSFILIAVMLIISANAYLQYFASQTYNEAFYFMIQGAFFLAFFSLTDKLSTTDNDLKQTWKQWLTVGALLFLLSFVKNVAIVAVPAVVVYFLFLKEWKNAVIAAASFLAVKIPFEVIKKAVWGAAGQYGAQGDILKLKDPYDKTKGYEDTAGYITRLIDNTSIYLGKRFWEIIGFFSKDPVVNDKTQGTYAMLGFILFIVLLVAIIIALVKKQKTLLMVLIYVGAMLATSFVALQTRWDQPRIIVIFVPLILIAFFYVLFELGNKFSAFKNIAFAFVCIVALSSFISSFKKASANIPSMKKNLGGDILFGYTPDWIHFLRMSQWCGENLPDTTIVASRKAPMSFIYGKGQEFFPVYRVLALDTVTKYSNPDSILLIMKKNKVTHMLLASIRMDPNRPTANIINTLHRMLQPVAQKYPMRVKLVHQIPSADLPQVEPAHLYEVNWWSPLPDAFTSNYLKPAAK